MSMQLSTNQMSGVLVAEIVNVIFDKARSEIYFQMHSTQKIN